MGQTVDIQKKWNCYSFKLHEGMEGKRSKTE